MLIAVMLAAAIGAASARAAAPPSEIMHFEIPAGELVDSVSRYTVQAQMSVLYEYDTLGKLPTQPVSGDFTAVEALQRMIQGLDIVLAFPYRRTVTLTRPGVGGPDAAIGTGRSAWARKNARAWVPTDRRGPLDPVVVNVQAKRENEPALASPVITLDSEDFNATGLVTTQDILRTLPQVFGGGPSEDTRLVGREAVTNAGRGYGVNLRALGAGSALLLINGRRLAVGGQEGSFVDVSSIPLPAVESMQIIPESSSTRYGADAVSGTVNFVMRQSFDGRLTSGHVGTTTKNDLNESYASQLVGGSTATGSGLFAVDFYTRDNLAASRRSLVTSDLTRFGGTNFNLPLSAPGTIIAGGTTWAIPGTPGAPLVPGTSNLSDRFAGVDVLPNQQRVSLFGTWKNELTDSMTFFTDVLASERRVRGATAAIATGVPVPPTNPFYVNPAGGGPVAVGYSFLKELGPVDNDGKVNTSNIAAGLEWDFAPLWHVVGTGVYASEKLNVDFRNSLDQNALFAALLDPNPQTALNLFGDGGDNNPATIEKLRTTRGFSSRSFLKSLNVTANGPLFRLPSGSVRLRAGADYREQEFASATRITSTSPALRASTDRFVRSLFAEACIPVWGESDCVVEARKLDLSIGARYEDYSDVGDSVTPRYGIEWSPVQGFTFRGSWSHSFRVPSLMDLNESTNSANIGPLLDSSGPTQALVWFGKNADLRKETARSWTAGFDFRPTWEPRLSFATTYFEIDFKDRLTALNPVPDLLTNPRFADLVTRNPTAAQVASVCSRAPITAFALCNSAGVGAIVDLRLRNDERMQTRGFDVIGKYARDTRFGTFSFGLNGTYILDFEEAASRGLPLQERVSTQNYPVDLRLRSSFGWKRGGLDATAFANFSNHYRDTVSNRDVRSMTTLDLNAAYTFSAARGSWLSRTTVALSAENVFDRDPPFLNNTIATVGYDEENADVIGRFVSFTIRQSW